jgi:hypothetical protein
MKLHHFQNRGLDTMIGIVDDARKFCQNDEMMTCGIRTDAGKEKRIPAMIRVV